MPILNYTTGVEAAKTVSEIISLLVRKGASTIIQDFGPKGEVVAVRFILKVGEVPVPFALPSNASGVLKSIKRSAQPRYHTMEQAERVSWRILKDWVEAQMALVESGQGEMSQVFMPYAVMDGGRTMHQLFVESTQKQLGAGE